MNAIRVADLRSLEPYVDDREVWEAAVLLIARIVRVWADMDMDEWDRREGKRLPWPIPRYRP